MIVVEDGTGTNPAANTYVDPAGTFAAAYVAGSLYTAAWNDASTGRREAAVISASRTLDALYAFRGNRTVTGQPLAWPRSGVRVDGVTIGRNQLPVALLSATMEMAIALLDRNRLSDTSSGSQALEEISLGSGALELKFGSDPTATPITADNMVPPYVAQLLRGYGTRAGTGGMVPIVRR